MIYWVQILIHKIICRYKYKILCHYLVKNKKGFLSNLWNNWFQHSMLGGLYQIYKVLGRRGISNLKKSSGKNQAFLTIFAKYARGVIMLGGGVYNFTPPPPDQYFGWSQSRLISLMGRWVSLKILQNNNFEESYLPLSSDSNHVGPKESSP